MTQGTDPLDVEQSAAVSAASPPASPVVERATDRDLQRSALRDLVDLATSCATEEVQIETRYRDELAAAEKELSDTRVELANKLDALRHSVQQKHDERVAEAESQLDYDGRQLKESDLASRSRIAAEYEASEGGIRQKLDQAVWLAESVFEATQIQCGKDSDKADEEYKTQKQQLAEMESQAFDLLTLYRVSMPTPEPVETEGEAPATQTARAPAPDKAEAAFKQHRDEVAQHLQQLKGLQVPRLFVGGRPYLIGIAAMTAAVVVSQIVAGQSVNSFAEMIQRPALRAIGYGAGGMAVALLAFGLLLWFLGVRQVRSVFQPLSESLDAARLAAKTHHQHLTRTYDSKYSHAMRKRDAEVRSAKDQAGPSLKRAQQMRDASLQVAESERKRQLAKMESRRDKAVADLKDWLTSTFAELDERYQRDLANVGQRHDDRIARSKQQHDDSRAALESRWREGLRRIQQIEDKPSTNGNGNGAGTRRSPAPRDWKDSAWNQWVPPRSFSTTIPFGQFKVDLKQVTESVDRGADGQTQLELPDEFSLPALLAFPSQSSLLIQYDRAGRDAAIRALQMVMTRLLTNLPPGRVRFTIIDPVGLGQNFAGFMHLADHDEALVGGRIWTNTEHIDQRLGDLTEHMETVIQKYLRNEFATIDDYNAQAGELAEPYRFLVIADFPVNVSPEAIQKLNSIASTGARCGVYTLIARDLRAALPGGSHVDELITHSVNLVQQPDGKFTWKDEVFEQFPLAVDPPPAEESLTNILNVVGRHAKDASRVEVPFETIAPKPEQVWTGDCTSELRVPIGRMGATRSQLLKLGRGVAQHSLIAGKTGSGKSTLLHVLVTNLALWYHPDEVEFYLVDFKKGVEFKTYATHTLPHARAIAVESDREFGLSVLQRLDAELSRRGEMFRKLGVQDLAAYREASGKKLPRTLLIIDEFQEFFSEDDKLAQDASLLIDRLVRQGRAFGVHVILGSQTIGGSSSIPRSTIGQMAVRIALQTSEADSQLILGDSNSAARLLSRPGEAIYNDQGGLVEANSPFQISWLPDEQRDGFLDQVEERVKREQVKQPEPIVFEGNAAADIVKNRRLEDVLAAKAWSETESVAPLAWLGEPVAIKDATSVAFRRQSGANVLLVGQQEESAAAIMAMSLVALAAQHAPGKATFYVFDGTPADSALAGTFNKAASALPGHDVKLVEWRAVEETINAISEEMKRRQEDAAQTHPSAIFIMIYGLQRYRVLRKSEDSSFSFSMDDDEKKKVPVDKQFADILREGPALGIHVITWADAPAAVERTLDRTSLREFDHRVLFQMSANDSSNLIDSPAANKLGFHRALAFSEEQGVMEKFRPYALPGKPWLEHVKSLLEAKG